MANSEQYRETVAGQYNPTKPALNQVSQDVNARASADGKTGVPKAHDTSPAKANGKHIDDETIKQLTAKYTGGQVFPTQSQLGEDAKGDTGGGGAVKGKVQSVAIKTGEVTGRTETASTRTDKFKDDFSTADHRRDKEEENKGGKPVYKRPLVMAALLVGFTAVAGFLFTATPSARQNKRDENVTS